MMCFIEVYSWWPSDHSLLVAMILVAMTCLLQETEGNPGELRDYCWPREFNASCGEDEVILMQSARYGRMNKPQSVCSMSGTPSGCFADVLTQMDSRCSGRRYCEVKIPDEELHDLQPCPKDLLMILEAKYICVKVTYPERYPCYPAGLPQLLTATEPGYLLGTVVTPGDTDPPVNVLGGPLEPNICSWRIEVEKGQRVNLTLYDFSVSTASEREDHSICLMYATVSDSAGSADMTVCRGTPRVKNLIESTGMSVDLKITTYNTENPDGMFLIKYDAIGCPDPVVAKDATFKRNLDKVSVTCNHSAETWFLYCNGTTWVGPRRNCTKAMPLSKTTGDTNDDSTFPFGLATAVIIGIILGILIGLALLAVILVLNRRRKQHRQRYIADGSTQPTPFGGTGGASTFVGTRLPPDGMTKSYKLDQYGYAHVWELHHLHDCHEESPGVVTPASVASTTLGGELKPLKYSAGNGSEVPINEPGGYVYGINDSATLKLSACPHQTALCGHHIGGQLYSSEGDNSNRDCQHLDLGNSVMGIGTNDQQDGGLHNCSSERIIQT